MSQVEQRRQPFFRSRTRLAGRRSVASPWLLWICFGLLPALIALFSCTAHTDNSHIRLAPPVESTTLGPGDVFTMEIVGEKDLPTEYQIASDGTVDLPYLHAVEVAGLEPQEVSGLVRNLLIKRQILTDPSVIVRVHEYNSKRITVLGQVNKPGSFALSPDMTIIQALSLAGGINAIGNADRVNLTRRGNGRAKTVQLSIQAITEGRAPDIPLQAGDQIFVKERLF